MERLRSRAAIAPPLSADPAPACEPVSLLVPLLNDGHRVTRFALSLMRQIRVPKLDIVFLDAGSTDLTRRLLLHATRDDRRVRLLIGAPTPPGWCAYAHACEQLAVAARGRSFVFADPGLALAPAAVAAAVAALRGHGAAVAGTPGGRPAAAYDAVLTEARLRTRTPVAVRGAQPDPAEPPLSTTARLLAVDADTYWRVGGHCNAAHDAMGEAGLLRAVHLAGGRVARADGRHAIEFLDGSAWPAERAGADATAVSRSRSYVPDTENSILHSFTDTARRLLAALTAAPPTPQQAQRSAQRPATRVLTHRGNARAGQLRDQYAATRGRRELPSGERLALTRGDSPSGRR